MMWCNTPRLTLAIAIAAAAPGVRGQSLCFGGNEAFVFGQDPQSLTIADLDGDGDGDLIAANPPMFMSSLTVRLNQGDGTFAPASTYPTAPLPASIAAADLDGDGDLDLVTTPGSGVSVLLNQGNGTFAAPVTYSALGRPYGLAVGDLDGDGDVDVVATRAGSTLDNTALEFLNQGNGTLAAPVSYLTGATGAVPISVRMADLDNDGDLDLAVANYQASEIGVLLNQGNATFAAPVPYATGSNPDHLQVGDLDADGDSDLVATRFNGSEVVVHLNQGSASFSVTHYPTGALPEAVSIADLDGDGDGDLAVACYSSSEISLLLNSGSGTFAVQPSFPMSSGPSSIASADLDGDGDHDLAVSSGYVFVLRNCIASGTPFCAGDGSTIPCPCGNNGAPNQGCANSIFASGALLSASGVQLVSADSVVLDGAYMSGDACVFYQGEASFAPVVLDDGLGCVNGPLIRLGTKAVSGGAATYPVGADAPISIRGQIPAAGATRYYQCFYRNSAATFCPPATSNRTNGVAIVWAP